MTGIDSIQGMAQFSCEELAERCNNESADKSHRPFCFEIFRRAIVETNMDHCWQAIFDQYMPQVERWVRKFMNNQSTLGSMTVDDIAQDAMLAFVRAYKATHLAQAKGLESVLDYLRSCAATSVQQVQRKLRRQNNHGFQVDLQTLDEHSSTSAASDTNIDDEIIQQLSAGELWAIVDACCEDEADRVLARLNFANNMKSRQILYFTFW